MLKNAQRHFWSFQWEIYDAYTEELQKQEMKKDKQRAFQIKKDDDQNKKKISNDTQVAQLTCRVFFLAHCATRNNIFLYWVDKLCIYIFLSLQSDDITPMAMPVTLLERMVNQNTCNDIAQGGFIICPTLC